MASSVDTAYRSWPLAALEAVRDSTLLQLKNIEGMGQSSSGQGRQTAHADYATLHENLTNIYAALEWKAANPNGGNAGYQSRYASFNNNCC